MFTWVAYGVFHSHSCLHAGERSRINAWWHSPHCIPCCAHRSLSYPPWYRNMGKERGRIILLFYNITAAFQNLPVVSSLFRHTSDTSCFHSGTCLRTSPFLMFAAIQSLHYLHTCILQNFKHCPRLIHIPKVPLLLYLHLVLDQRHISTNILQQQNMAKCCKISAKMFILHKMLTVHVCMMWIRLEYSTSYIFILNMTKFRLQS